MTIYDFIALDEQKQAEAGIQERDHKWGSDGTGYGEGFKDYFYWT